MAGGLLFWCIYRVCTVNHHAGRKVADFKIVGCMGDGFLLNNNKVAIGLAWGGPGTGTLPMSEQEWNWPGHTGWNDELQKTFK